MSRRTVRDESGKRYVLLTESAESSRVRDPETGEERYVANAELEPVEGESPLVTAARTVPDPVRLVLSATRDERALGLLLEIDDRGPVRVAALLEYDLCESDVHGLLGEFRAAGLLESVEEGGGERTVRTTETASEGLDLIRD